MKPLFYVGFGDLYRDWNTILSASQLADELEFEGLLMQDHYDWGPNSNWGRERANTLDPFIVFSYLAAKTRNLKFATIVTPIPLRPPAILAKIVANLDALSGGRMILGVGAGWSKDEFEAYGEWNEAKVRVDKTHEALELMIKLWTEDVVDFEGVYYQTKAARLEPKPVQKPHPKLLFGGGSKGGKRMLSLAGRYADICLVPVNHPEGYDSAKERVIEAAKEAGRISEIEFLGRVGGWDKRLSIQEIPRFIESEITKGNRHLWITPPLEGEQYREFMTAFARDIKPSFQ